MRFPVSTSYNIKSATFRTLGDLVSFLGTFELPQISIPDWPLKTAAPGLPLTLDGKLKLRKNALALMHPNPPLDEFSMLPT